MKKIILLFSLGGILLVGCGEKNNKIIGEWSRPIENSHFASMKVVKDPDDTELLVLTKKDDAIQVERFYGQKAIDAKKATSSHLLHLQSNGQWCANALMGCFTYIESENAISKNGETDYFKRVDAKK
jgi:hypothetical protein